MKLKHCPHCNAVIDSDKPLEYDGNKGNGKWCPNCKQPLDSDSVDKMHFGMTPSMEVIVKDSLKEKIAVYTNTE